MGTGSDRAAVVFVLLCVQAALSLLGVIGLVLFMGNPLYLVGSVARSAVLVWLGVKILRGRPWALVVTVLLEWASLLGVWVGLLLGLLPGLTPSVTLTGLLTSVGLPIAIVWSGAGLLAASARAGDPPTVPLPVLPGVAPQPFAPAGTAVPR